MRTFMMFLSRPITAWRERSIARRAAQCALSLYNELRRERPAMSKANLYEEFVKRRNGLEASDAKILLRMAEQSFAAWPVERALIFRDVVQYMVVSERLASTRTTTTADIAFIVGRIIPFEL